MRAVTELFHRHGIPLSHAHARQDMGIFKRDHIRNILAISHVSQQWRELTGAAPNEQDVAQLFSHFLPLQMSILEDYSQVIQGVPALAERLRGRGLRLGGTTGYTRPMLEVLAQHAGAQGYYSDLALCPDDAPGGPRIPGCASSWRSISD